MAQNSMVIFERAAIMLAEADTIQKAKELKSLALTAGEWAKRNKAGQAAILHCRSYALDAERKMGEMLAASDLSKSGPGRGKKGVAASNRFSDAPTLDELGLSKRESAEAQKLAELPSDRFEALKAGERTRKEALNPTHVGHNSGENEWYTPPEFIEAALAAMGGIDCDPASSKIANKTVKAGRFFSKDDDGLAKEWHGRVWMNPPYAQPLIGQFSEAVSAKYESKEIKQACVLVNNATETAWFQRMLGVCAAICFPKSRIRFLDQAGHPGGAPLQGQAVLYFGNRVSYFRDAFKGFGPILVHD